MAESQKPNEPPAERTMDDDEDLSSEFSVISMHDDHESTAGEVEAMSESHVYVTPSEVCCSELADGESLSEPPNMSPMMSSFASEQPPPELELPTPWSPDTLSGYVSTSAVADMTNKLYQEYKLSHDMLNAISNSLSDLKTSKGDRNNVEGELVYMSEQIVKLQQELADAKAAYVQTEEELAETKETLDVADRRIIEAHQEKFQLETRIKTLENENQRIELLEAQLREQCRLNKNLRERLDETQDELVSTGRELSNQKEITQVLQLNDRDSAERLQLVNEDYQNQISSLQMLVNSYYERNEAEALAATPSNRTESLHSWVSTSLPSSRTNSIGPTSSTVDRADGSNTRRFLLPPSINGAQYQVFFCDCMHAFPTRGSLVTHRAKCSSAVAENA